MGDGGQTVSARQEARQELARQQARDMKARTLLDVQALTEAGFVYAGTVLASACLLKGRLNAAEQAGGDLLAGPDGEALRAALHTLGYLDDSWSALATCVHARGEEVGLSVTDSVATAACVHACGEEGMPGLRFDRKGPATCENDPHAMSWQPADAKKLAWALEVFDPELVIALDEEASRAACAAWGVTPAPAWGEPVVVRGRRLLCLNGFEAALAAPADKRRMWESLKRVPPLTV